MPPRICQMCNTSRALVKRPKTGQQVCKTCFFLVFETEVHNTITENGGIFKRGDKVAIGASGGKDSTVLAHVMTVLNKRYDYGLDLCLLSIDEGITGYRDDSLETVKQNQKEYSLPLLILSYSDLYGYTMDRIVSQIGSKNNCTFCGVFRRQALDRGAGMLGVEHIVTGHNADDIAETVLMNIMRGDIARLSRCTQLVTQGEDTIHRSKPFKYAYEKEIVMYAYFKKLTYFSTECIYSPDAYRGHARVFLKDLESIRPSAIIDIIHSGEAFQVEESVVRGMKAIQTCLRCGYISSNDLCKACALLEGLEHGLDKTAAQRRQVGGAETIEGHRTIAMYTRPSAKSQTIGIEPTFEPTSSTPIDQLRKGIEHTHIIPPPRNPDEKFLLSIMADPPDLAIVEESIRKVRGLASAVTIPFLGRWYGRQPASSSPSRPSIPQRARRRLARVVPSLQTLTFLLGLGTTFWIAVGWAALRMREGRDLVRAERERKERLRQHFSSTLTNISFTVYALLPTLLTQIFSKLDVEATIAELTDLAGAGSSEKSKSMESSGVLSEVAPAEAVDNGATAGGSAAKDSVGSQGAYQLQDATDLDPTSSQPIGDQSADATQFHDRIATGSSSQTIMPSHSSWANEFSSTQPNPTGRGRELSLDRSVIETASDISDLGGMTSGSELDVSISEHETRHGGQPVPPPSSSFTHASLPSETFPRESSGISMTGSSPSPPESSALHLSSGNVSQGGEHPNMGAGQLSGREEPTVPLEKKTKAQLWNEVKIKSITRSITSIYVIPLLILQTTSQLTLLSRLHLLRGMSGERLVRSAKAEADSEEGPLANEFAKTVPTVESAVKQGKRRVEESVESMWKPWEYFSVENMGLAEHVKDVEDSRTGSSVLTASGALAGISSLVGSVSSLLYQTSPASTDNVVAAGSAVSLEDAVDVATERAFLCFSWWFLHVGWKILEARVELAVVEVFKGVGLKKAMTIDDWADLVNQVRQRIEAELGSDGTFKPFDLLPLLLPPTDPAELQRSLREWPAFEDCPFLDSPPTFPLSTLLEQTRLHLASPDFSLVLPICIDVLHRSLLDDLATALYSEDLTSSQDQGDIQIRQLSTKRVVECLPAFTNWSKRIWEGVPDGAVDRILGMKEVEAFTALVYGDFREANGL